MSYVTLARSAFVHTDFRPLKTCITRPSPVQRLLRRIAINRIADAAKEFGREDDITVLSFRRLAPAKA